MTNCLAVALVLCFLPQHGIAETWGGFGDPSPGDVVIEVEGLIGDASLTTSSIYTNSIPHYFYCPKPRSIA